MAGASEVVSLLEKHKSTIVRELSKTNILTVLVKKGVLSPQDEELVLKELNDSVKGDVFIEIISRKGVDAFKEFCFALETECPHLLTDLLAENLGKRSDCFSFIFSFDYSVFCKN